MRFILIAVLLGGCGAKSVCSDAAVEPAVAAKVEVRGGLPDGV